MDILSLLRTLRRHWLLVLPVALLTVAGLVWAVVVKDPAYESTTTITLLAPPAPPIDDDGQPITRTEEGSTDNPLTRFGDQSVIVNRVSRSVGTDANRRDLAAAGAVPDFEIETGNGPEAIITAEATTPEQAELTVTLVAESFVDQLENIQSEQGIDPTYYFTTLPLEPPSVPAAQLSSTLRVGIGILGLGIIATFVVVSIGEARRISREQTPAADDDEEPGGTTPDLADTGAGPGVGPADESPDADASGPEGQTTTAGGPPPYRGPVVDRDPSPEGGTPPPVGPGADAGGPADDQPSPPDPTAGDAEPASPEGGTSSPVPAGGNGLLTGGAMTVAAAGEAPGTAGSSPTPGAGRGKHRWAGGWSRRNRADGTD